MKNMNKTTHKIASVAPGSIAEELELAPGDVILAINDQEIEDIFDYHYLVEDAYLVMLVEKPDGEQWELEIEKDEDEDLGITFENGLMDDYKSAAINVCSALSTRCRRACGIRCISRTTTPDCPFYREIT